MGIILTRTLGGFFYLLGYTGVRFHPFYLGPK
jgi:hypothetical protein